MADRKTKLLSFLRLGISVSLVSSYFSFTEAAAFHDRHHVLHQRHHVLKRADFAGFSVFQNGTLSSLGLSSSCEEAMYQVVNCDDSAQSVMVNGYIGSSDNSALLCDTGCEASIQSLHEAVSSECSESPNLTTFLGYVDKLWSGWNQSCFVDPDTGDNCNDVIAAFPEVESLEEMADSDMCSYCYLQKFALMQSSAYDTTYDSEFYESRYEYVASACNVTVDDFSPTPSIFNFTTDAQEDTCNTGNYYTTVEGDTCDSIAHAQSVSAASLYYINWNIVNCSSIVVGTELCLPLTCETLWDVQEDDTCTSIAVEYGLYTQDIVTFNTLLNYNCSNLHSTNPYWGSTICASTPGGEYESDPVSATTSDGTGSDGYTTTVVDPPTGVTVANGTTLECGSWYTNDDGYVCAQICLLYDISINLFTEVNPSLNMSTCDTDLVTGAAYCVGPLESWDGIDSSSSSSNSTTTTGTVVATTATATGTATTSATAAATPSPTQANVVTNCNAWHYVVSGDGCWAISQTYGIELSDFYEWNPDVGSDCAYLWLDYYVCVGVE